MCRLHGVPENTLGVCDHDGDALQLPAYINLVVLAALKEAGIDIEKGCASLTSTAQVLDSQGGNLWRDSKQCAREVTDFSIDYDKGAASIAIK
jgi:hypothetical protein